MYYYTISIDEEGMEEVLADLRERINAFSKRRKPLSVIVTEEAMSETMGGTFCRFNLVVTPDFEVKNERQAMKFCQAMKAAAEEVQQMNDANYIVFRHLGAASSGARIPNGKTRLPRQLLFRRMQEDHVVSS